MLNIVLRPLAKLDIKKIWRYTHKEWGIKQADNYVQQLGQTLHKLAGSPMQGLSIDRTYKDCLLYHYRRHIIIYTCNDTTLVVQRVLHEKMDISRHPVQ